MRRIFDLAKVSKLEVGIVQSLFTREVSLTSQVNQAKSSKGKSGKSESASTRKKSVGGGKTKTKSPRSPFSSSSSSRFFKTTSPLSSSSRSNSKSKSKSKSTSRSTNKRGLSIDRMDSSSVRQDKAANKFTLDLGNNQVARIDYKQIGKNKLDLYHSEVPSELRGRGIGKALARGAFEIAASSNTKLRLSCSYLEDFINKCADPKLKKLVEK